MAQVLTFYQAVDVVVQVGELVAREDRVVPTTLRRAELEAENILGAIWVQRHQEAGLWVERGIVRRDIHVVVLVEVMLGLLLLPLPIVVLHHPAGVRNGFPACG